MNESLYVDSLPVVIEQQFWIPVSSSTDKKGLTNVSCTITSQ